jgi:hypothetical protein
MSFEFPVEAGRIRDFALAIGEADPWDGTGSWILGEGPPVPAQPTFAEAHRCYISLEERNRILGLELDYRRLVHGEQTYRFERMPLADEILVGTVRVSKDEVREGRRGGRLRLITLETSFTDRDDAEVLVSECTLVETSKEPTA